MTQKLKFLLINKPPVIHQPSNNPTPTNNNHTFVRLI